MKRNIKSCVCVGFALASLAISQLACISENPVDQNVEKTINNAPAIVESVSNGIVESGQSVMEIGKRADSVAK